MRIWLLSSELPHEIAGGIGRYVANWARLLAAAGHEVVVIAVADGPSDELAAAGVQVVAVKPRFTRLSETAPEGDRPTQPGYPYDVLGYAAALSHQMADEVLALLGSMPRPDVIESQEFGALPYFLLQRKLTEATSLATIPILVHLHGPAFELARLNREPVHRFPEYWTGRMERFCVVAADALLSPSRFLADHMARTLERDLDIEVVPHPFAVAEPTPTLAPEPRRVVAVGRLQAVKGIVPLLDACDRLWQRGSTFRLVLVGDDAPYAPTGGTLGAHLAARHRRHVAEGRLELTGRVAHDVALDHMRRAAVVVVPSLFENFPNTCLEAMSLGQVVLATRSGGQAEMIGDEDGGLLFDWETTEDFERQLARALALDDGGRHAIGARARARLRSLCDPTRVLERRLRHYETIAARAEPRRTFPTLAPGIARLAPAVDEPDVVTVTIIGDEDPAAHEETVASVRASRDVTVEVDSRTPDAPVAFVRAGDLVEPELLARARDVLRRHANVGFVYAWVRYRDPATGVLPTWNAELPYALGHAMVPTAVVVRRAALQDWGGDRAPDDAPRITDLDGWLDLLNAGWAGVSLPDVLIRQRPPARATAEDAAPIYARATRRHAALYQAWAVDLFHLQNANGPGAHWYHPAAPSPLADPLRADDVRWIDQEIGGRLVNRLRRTWLARQVLRRPALRRLLRRLV